MFLSYTKEAHITFYPKSCQHPKKYAKSQKNHFDQRIQVIYQEDFLGFKALKIGFQNPKKISIFAHAFT